MERTKKLQLANGGFSLVDAQHYPLLIRYTWTRTPTNYVVTQSNALGGKLVLLHRFLTGAGKGQVVDHVNGNGLDNRDSNLRRCTVAENVRNSRGNKGKRFKGVFKRGNRNGRSMDGWFAAITINNRQKYLGHFLEQEDAAMAYDIAAKKAYGKFAWLNLPERYGTFKKPVYRCEHGVRQINWSRKPTGSCRECRRDYFKRYDREVRKPRNSRG